MKRSVFCFALMLTALLSILSFNTAIAQENLDVLPVTGRNELFHSYLMLELDTLVQKRQLAVDEALTAAEKLIARQKQLRQDYYKLVGKLPGKTPLNPIITRTIECDGYKIDNVIYESVPNHHVTANFYYPTNGTGPFPGILITCGHYPVAKSIELLQQLCILLVKNGFTVLIVDPIGQGERVQIVDPKTGKLYFTSQSGTSEHSRLDVGSVINGTSVVAYELWDNLRSIDYMFTRPEVDTNKIGVEGSSGGGAQATYLSAFDERIKVAVIDSYIMNEQTLYKTIGPQTGSQNLSYEGFLGIDHPDYITMFAPKPFLITASTKDFFDIGATRKTYAEAQEVYYLLGGDENIGYFESDAEHGLNKEKREKTVEWFLNWFYSDYSDVTEPENPLLKYDSLRVTTTGQVYTSFENEITVTGLNVTMANSFASARESFWSNNSKDSCLNMVKNLIRFDSDTSVFIAENVETIDRDYYTIEKIKITQGNLVPITGLLFIPKGVTEKMQAVVYVDGRGKSTDAAAGGIIEKVFVDSGKVVFAIDVRGFGETTDNPGMNETKHGNNEHRNAVIGLYIGKTFIGQRVEDILKATDYLLSRETVDPGNIRVEGIGRAASSVLHAAALDNRFKEIVIRNADSSWMDIIEDPTILNNMTHVVPSSMMYYDLPDLVDAISPRKVVYNPADYVIPEDTTESGTKILTYNDYELSNYPNPFQHTTKISYYIDEPAHVSLVVYNLQGNIIQTLIDQDQYPESYTVSFGNEHTQPGIYFYKLLIDGREADTKKMVVIE